jgi:hypothetical protein
MNRCFERRFTMIVTAKASAREREVASTAVAAEATLAVFAVGSVRQYTRGGGFLGTEAHKTKARWPH